MSVDIQSLIRESKCYSCLGVNEEQSLELALLGRIAEGGSFTVPVLSISLSSTANSLQLSWTDGTPQPSYELWRHLEGGTYSLYKIVSALSYTDTSGMGIHEVWYFKVRAVGALKFSNEIAVSRNLNFSATAVTSISYPTLVIDVGTVGMSFQNNANLVSIDLPALRQCKVMIIHNNAALVSATFPSLVTCTSPTSGTTISNNPVLTTLNYASMISGGGADYDVHSNVSLTTIVMTPAFRFGVASSYLFSDCAFTLVFEAFILQCLIDSPFSGLGSDFFLNGGANAPNDGTLDPLITILSNPPYNDNIVTN